MTNYETLQSDQQVEAAISNSKLSIRNNSDATVRCLFWLTALVLGFLQAWASRATISSDAVSYFDIGRSVWNGQWSAAINGLWNPLYSVILGIAIGLFKPSLNWVYPTVHIVLFLIFVCALWCYDFLLQQLIALREETRSHSELVVPRYIWLCVGYTIFLWATLRLVKVSETNPDMLVAAMFFLACGFLVKIRRQTAGWASYAGLGLALGLGYLTKSIMFPVAICCMAVAFFLGHLQTRRMLAAMAVFLLVAGPYITALSLAKGRFSFGDSGRYNYAFHVNHIPQFHWQGEQGDIPGNGKPTHPTRMIVAQPPTFEFAYPIGGTYPAWTDPSYWYDGVKPRVDLVRTLSREFELLGGEAYLLFDLHGSLIGCVFLMLYMSGRRWSIIGDLSVYWFLIAPCMIMLALYAAVHVEPRYVAPFLSVLLVCVFLAIRLPASRDTRRLCSGIAILMLVMFLEPLQSPSLNIKQFVRDIVQGPRQEPESPAEVVRVMSDLGLRPGDRIASVQRSDLGMSTWACLAQVQIVAEVNAWPDAAQIIHNNFWDASVDQQEAVIRAFSAAGVRFIVSQTSPPRGEVANWRKVGGTQYYVYEVNSAHNL
jgi:hypothetical protein